jgi:hypothetical protein
MLSPASAVVPAMQWRKVHAATRALAGQALGAAGCEPVGVVAPEWVVAVVAEDVEAVVVVVAADVAPTCTSSMT